MLACWRVGILSLWGASTNGGRWRGRDARGERQNARARSIYDDDALSRLCTMPVISKLPEPVLFQDKQAPAGESSRGLLTLTSSLFTLHSFTRYPLPVTLHSSLLTPRPITRHARLHPGHVLTFMRCLQACLLSCVSHREYFLLALSIHKQDRVR